MHRNARDILQCWHWFYVQHIYSLHNVEVVWYGCPWWCAEQFIVAVVGSDRTNLNPACGLQPQSYYTCGQRPQSSYTTTDRRQHHSIGTTFTIHKNCFDDEAPWFCNIETLCRCVNVILSELLRILQTSALPKEKMYGQENLIHELCLIQRAELCIAKYVIESGALYTKSIWRLISDGRCSSPLSSSILPLLPPAAPPGHHPPPVTRLLATRHPTTVPIGGLWSDVRFCYLEIDFWPQFLLSPPQFQTYDHTHILL